MKTLPDELHDQMKELNLIIKYLCEHSKIMDRNYIKSRKELDDETLELKSSRAFLLEDIDQMELKVCVNCRGSILSKLVAIKLTHQFGPLIIRGPNVLFQTTSFIQF